MKNLNELTIKECIEGLKLGNFTSLQVTQACLTIIKNYDQKVDAFITITKDLALKQAKDADEIIKNLGAVEAFSKFPLLGVPYAAKDNFSTKGIETTAATNILRGYIPPYESTVTSRLKEAGAVLLGKTNMDAFAHGSSGETSDYKVTKNPFDLTKIPGGSSAGSAAAVAANMCIFAIGSETAGSIRGPASWTGTVGLKPTYGRVSRYGVVAMASSTDSPGPLTKSVWDAAYVLNIIAGLDANDATSSPSPVAEYSDITKKDLKGLRIGRPKSYFEIDLEENTKKEVNSAIAKLKDLGAEVIEMDLLDPKYSIAVYTIIQRSEVSSNLARYDGIRYGQSRENFGFEAKKRMMLGAYALSSGYYDAYYAKAQKVRTLIIEDFNKAFEKVDAIVSPTMPCVALPIGEYSKSPMFGELMDVLAEPSSISGHPGISVNCGFDNGLPIGLQFIGKHLDEKTIIDIAHVFESNTDFGLRKPNLQNL